MYQLAAWLVLGVHATWVAFLLAGFPLGRRNRWLRSLHLGGLILNMALETFDLPCPLTELEKWLMSHYRLPYTGTCISHYVQTSLAITLAPRMVVFFSFVLWLASAWAYGLIRSPLRR
ncbi:MAG: DUF2784 family protein [candidate division NC10 bacterium]|nr:DUF2784 family protein [candidate division NC10 bacterium]